MTDTSNKKTQLHPPICRRREAKQFAWRCFFKKENTLLLIGATLIPIVLFMAGQGIYTMLYLALENTVFLSQGVIQLVNVLFIAMSVPLIGGLMYIVTGLAHEEDRQIKDVFYPYTSPRAFFRTVIALLLPGGTISVVISVTALAVNAAQGLYELSALMEEGAALYYGDVFWYGGILLAVAVCFVGVVLTGYLFPLFWLVFGENDQPLTRLLLRSIRVAHRRLLPWLVLQCSFLGWLALSAATVGVLLVLFVIPYYLLTVTRYVDLSCGVDLLTD